MLEPILTLDAEMRVEEYVKYQNEYPGFDWVAVRNDSGDSVAWFAFGVPQLRWLLQDVDAQDTLRAALELGETEATPVYEGRLDAIPERFEGVVVAGDEAVAYAAAQPEAALGAHRGGGASAAPPVPGAPAEPEAEERETVVPVFFATDRQATGRDGPYNLFGAERGDLHFGKIDVSIPPDHERGEIEVPKWWKLEFRANPKKHVTLRSVETYDEAGFLAAMGARFEETAEREALVFVHGYKVGFDDGIRRTAQIAHDLRFKGAPILYSWPSANRLLRYTHDETNARWTEAHFTRFLELVLNRSGAEAVHVIAHSMGNRVVSESLHALPSNVETSRLNQVILAAPDIDAATFEDIAERFKGKVRQITLYASSRDLALETSQRVHGYRRAGDSQPEVVIVDNVVTVDATRADTNLLGHSYVGDSKSILADIFHLLESGAPPEDRRFYLEAAEQKGKRYWLFIN